MKFLLLNKFLKPNVVFKKLGMGPAGKWQIFFTFKICFRLAQLFYSDFIELNPLYVDTNYSYNQQFIHFINLNGLLLKICNHFQEVKQVISDYDPNMLVDNALTLEGFLYLHQMFIQRGRHETVWTVLKRFGHYLNLQLRQDYLLPKSSIYL